MGSSLRQIEELLGVLPARGQGPRPFDPGSLGPGRGQSAERSWRSSTRPASLASGPSPWTRSFLGATDLGRDRASKHDGSLLLTTPRTARPRPGRSNWSRFLVWNSPSPTPPRGSPRRLRNSLKSVATTPPRAVGARPGHLPHRDGGQTGPGPSTGVAPRRPGRQPRPPTPRSPGRSSKGSTREAWPEPPAHAWDKASRGVRAGRASRGGLGPCHAALDLFDPDGQPQRPRPTPRPEIAAALKDLTGPDWSKVRNFLNDRRSLSFLDRMHRRLESAEPRREWREAMAWRWWLRHRRPRRRDPLTKLVRRMCTRSAR